MPSVRTPDLSPETTDVLVIGAGPAGLMLAFVFSSFTCTQEPEGKLKADARPGPTLLATASLPGSSTNAMTRRPPAVRTVSSPRRSRRSSKWESWSRS